MCYVSKNVTINRRTLHVYKVVRGSGNASLFYPGSRGESGGWSTRGRILNYNPGTTVTSPSGPGIMAFLSLKQAQGEVYTSSRRIVVLSVPRGAWLRRGHWKGCNIICASRVRVLKRRVK